MRSKVVLDYLIKQGHQVKVVTFGKAIKYLGQNYDCQQVEGWELVYKKNKVAYLATAIKDAKKFPKVVQSFNQIRKLFNEFEPDIVFTDYEPMVSLLAKIKKLPCVSIGNHHFINKCKIKFPWRYWRDYWTVKVINEAWTPYASQYIITTFAEEKLKHNKAVLVPPIVPKDIIGLQQQTKNYILVYLTSGYKVIIDFLKKINQQFIVYGFNEDKTIANIQCKKFSRSEFINDLKDCKAVIANAGFTLISEAIYLKKPYLALPVAKQFEQIINAIYLEKLGYGKFCTKIKRKSVYDFIKNLDYYQKNLANKEQIDNVKLFKEIDKCIK